MVRYPKLPIEVAMETWAYLSLYFSEKLPAGVALYRFRLTGDPVQKKTAINRLQKAARHWDQVIDITKKHYGPTPYMGGEIFFWEKYRIEVERDLKIARDAQSKKSK